MSRNSIVELREILFAQLRAIQDTSMDEKERKMRVTEAMAVAKISDSIIKSSALQLRAIEIKDRFESKYGSDKNGYGLNLLACDGE